jgi:hypothetical protein
MHRIGTLGEKSLHAALKDRYAQCGGLIESEVEGFHIDIIRPDLLIEIQTAHFFSLKRKITRLVKHYPLRLVHPIAQEKWIVRMAPDSETPLSRRKSPQKGNLFYLFLELVSIPDLIRNPNFSIEVLLIQEEEIRCQDGKGSWRRKGLSIVDRRLIDILSRHLFTRPSDFLSLIPSDLKEPYSTQELAEGIGQPRWLAQKMAYCLRIMGVLEIAGKNGNAFLYASSKAIKT